MSHVVGVGHYGLTVRSVSEALPFFVEVLGFEVGDRVELDRAFSSSVTGLPNARISVTFLHGHGVVLELLEYDGDPNRSGVTDRSDVPGATHLALYVDDLDAVVAASKRYGWQVAGRRTPITVGPRAGGVAAYMTHLDGHVVELVQRPEGANR